MASIDRARRRHRPRSNRGTDSGSNVRIPPLGVRAFSCARLRIVHLSPSSGSDLVAIRRVVPPLGMRRSLIVDTMRQLNGRRTVIALNQRGPATPRDEGQLNAKSLTEGD